MTNVQVENPRYANDHHTTIAYDAVYYNEDTGQEIRRALIEVSSDDLHFHKILNEFGDTTLKDNKEEFLRERSRHRKGKQHEVQSKKDQDLFEYKTDLFDYNFVYNTSNRKLRRQIRKAQTQEEARFAATMILIYEVFGIEPQNDNITDLLRKISDE